MAIITTGSHPKALWPGVHAFVMGKYNEFPVEFSDVFDVLSSSLAYEEEVETTAFDLVTVKAEGAPTTYTGHSQGGTKRYTHIAYSLGYVVTKEEKADNQYKSKSFNRGELLARSFRISKEIVHWAVFNRAFSSSYTGMDAKELLATDHPTWAGTQQNELTVAADFSEAALEDVLTLIRVAKNSKGHPIALKAKKLIVSPYEAFNAERILKSSLQSGNANNDVNAIKSRGMLPGGYMAGTYLTDADAWFVTTDAPHGLKSFTRSGYEFTTDNDFDTENAKAKGYERYSCGWTDWRGLYGSPGA